MFNATVADDPFVEKMFMVVYLALGLTADDRVAIIVKHPEGGGHTKPFSYMSTLTPNELQDSVDFLMNLNNHAELDAQQVLANIKGLNHG